LDSVSAPYCRRVEAAFSSRWRFRECCFFCNCCCQKPPIHKSASAKRCRLVVDKTTNKTPELNIFFKKAFITVKFFKSKPALTLSAGAQMDLRKVLASSTRQNILKVLAEKREMQVMKLVSSVGSTYNELNRNLQLLEKEGLIINEYPVRVRHGKVRVIRLNKENPKTLTLLKVLKTLDQENNPKTPN
jgi:hypothetical protein